MRLPTAANRTSRGEDAEAAVRAVLALTAGIGAIAAVIDLAAGRAPVIALPTLLLAAGVAVAATIVAAYAAAGVWLVLVPVAPGEALLAPLAMILICVAIAVGPERMMSWAARDAAPPLDGPHDPVEPDGWIEDLGEARGRPDRT
jgi:hypothetical protein